MRIRRGPMPSPFAKINTPFMLKMLGWDFHLSTHRPSPFLVNYWARKLGLSQPTRLPKTHAKIQRSILLWMHTNQLNDVFEIVSDSITFDKLD